MLPQVGALVAGFVFGAVSNQAKFYISAVCGLVGLVRIFSFKILPSGQSPVNLLTCAPHYINNIAS